MFNLFGRKSAKDFMAEAKETYSVPEVKIPKKEDREFYRVGSTRYGDTTLTIIAEGGHSLTLTMNQTACEKLIRMLEATFPLEEDEPTEGVNG